MEFLSQPFFDAFGYTMIHALWQFTAISFFYFLIVTLFPKLSARRKFELGGLTLLLQLVVSLGTFMWLAFPQSAGERMEFLNINEGNALAFQIDAASGWNWTALLALIWMIGFNLCMAKLGIGWLSISKLKKSGVPMQEKLRRHLKQLALKINIPSNITLMESNKISVPVTMSHLKPIILFPIGLVNQLTSAQVEAILIHELAHIKYNDYLLNLFFSLIEAIFFFHPVVWWMSSQMNQFREESCDEQVLKFTDGPIEYAKALMSIQEFSFQHVPTAMSLTGKKGHLLKRIEKILVGKNQLQHKRELVFPLLFIFILASGFSLATLSARQDIELQTENRNFKKVGEKLAPMVIQLGNSSSESFPSENVLMVMPKDTDDVDVFIMKNDEGEQRVKYHYKSDNNKRKEELEMENGKVTKLKINGRLIPKEEYTDHQELIDKIKSTKLPPPPPAPAIQHFDDVPPPPSNKPERTFPEPPPPPPAPPVPDNRQGAYSYDSDDPTTLDRAEMNSQLEELEMFVEKFADKEIELNDFVAVILKENSTAIKDQLELVHEQLIEHKIAKEDIEQALENLKENFYVDLDGVEIFNLDGIAELENFDIQDRLFEADALIVEAHSLFGGSDAHPLIFEDHEDLDIATFKHVLRSELEADGLIKKDGKIKFQIDEDRVKVNGKKLNAPQSLKYKALFEEFYQKLPTEKFKIQWIDGNGSSSFGTTIFD